MGNILSHGEGNDGIQSLPIPSYPINPVQKIKYPTETRSLQILASDETLTYGGITMESRNHGKPNSPNIEIDTSDISISRPQAWKINDNWYYNYDGSIEEARFCGKRIPTEAEWQQFLRAIPGNASERSQIINGGASVGIYVPTIGEVWFHGKYSYWWCSQSGKELVNIPVIILKIDSDNVTMLPFGHNHAFSLRLMQ